MTYKRIDIACLELPEERLREVTEDGLAKIRQSISETGIQTPIVVRQSSKTTYRIIAGGHRYTIAKELGHALVPAIVRTYDKSERAGLEDELFEIDENLARAELSVGERALHEAERTRVRARIKNLDEREAAEKEAEAEKAAEGKVSKATRDRKSRSRRRASSGHDSSNGDKPVNRAAAKEYAKESAKLRGASVKTVQEDVQFGEAIIWAAGLTDTDKHVWVRPGSGFTNQRNYKALRSIKTSHGAWSKAATTTRDKTWRAHCSGMVAQIEDFLKSVATPSQADEKRPVNITSKAKEFQKVSKTEFEQAHLAEALVDAEAALEAVTKARSGLTKASEVAQQRLGTRFQSMRSFIERADKALTEALTELGRDVDAAQAELDGASDARE